MKPIAYLDDGFRAYLHQLIETGRLKKESGTTSLGITKIVLDKGFEALSGKQPQVFFEHVVEKLIVDKCKFCNHDILWEEMYEALDNGGYCKDCAIAHQEILKKKAG